MAPSTLPHGAHSRAPAPILRESSDPPMFCSHQSCPMRRPKGWTAPATRACRRYGACYTAPASPFLSGRATAGCPLAYSLLPAPSRMIVCFQQPGSLSIRRRADVIRMSGQPRPKALLILTNLRPTIRKLGGESFEELRRQFARCGHDQPRTQLREFAADGHINLIAQQGAFGVVFKKDPRTSFGEASCAAPALAMNHKTFRGYLFRQLHRSAKRGLHRANLECDRGIEPVLALSLKFLAARDAIPKHCGIV